MAAQAAVCRGDSRRGARIDTLAAAAGMGRTDDAERLLPAATADDRHRALALAAQLDHVEMVRGLLDAGEDPSRYNPPNLHAHATPLYWARHGGHEDIAEWRRSRGAEP